MKTSNEINGFIKSIASESLPDAEVLLFGSHARKNASEESDYDVLIVTSTELTPKEKLPIRTNIRKTLLAIGIRSDIMIQSKSEIEKKKNLPGHIIRRILHDAILL